MPLFGEKKPKPDPIREERRNITRTNRQMEREIAKLSQQEELLVRRLKASAEKGAPKAELEMMAKQLVQVRGQKKKLYAGTASMHGIDNQMATAQMSQKMAQSMHGASKAMKTANKEVDLNKMRKTAMEFDKQQQTMEMKNEMMDDALEGALGNDEEETEDILNSVLDEVGIELNSNMASAPSKKIEAEEEEEDMEDINARLKKLLGE